MASCACHARLTAGVRTDEPFNAGALDVGNLLTRQTGAMEKRVVFQSKWLPYALLAPQIAVTVIFFFWPAAQAVYYSFLVQDPFGNSSTFVWFQNYLELFRSSNYLE